MLRRILRIAALPVGLLALIVELCGYGLDRISDALYSAFCRMTE